MSTCRMVVVSAVLAFASCGVRAPSRIDVAALVKRRGEADARGDLSARIVADPKDIAARLALATLDDRTGRPSGALEQLEAVAALSGPIGIRWHDDDRARFAQLLVARGRARIARGASTALADLTRARDFGAKIDPRELKRARTLRAIAHLRHVDAKERDAGKRVLAELWVDGSSEPSWAGARTQASASERGAFGVWLWSQRARRAAWEELRAWHDTTPSPRDPALAAAYLTAYAWWTPADGPAPHAEDLVGPDRCRYATVDECALSEILARADNAALDSRVLAAPTRDDGNAAGWLAITLVQALRGEVSWGPAFASRVDLASLKLDAVPGPLRSAMWSIAGNGAAAEVGTLDPKAPNLAAQRLVVAAGRALRGGSLAQVRDALGANDGSDSRALLRVVDPTAPGIDRPHAAAVVAYVLAHVPASPDELTLRRIVDGYASNPLIADRLGRALVASAVDSATAYAALGALFQALGDPARARTAWQAAVDLSPDVDLQRGLAEALARAKDPDATLVATVAAAAAWGDPAIVWISVARALEATGEHQHALEAARSAIGLASGKPLIEAYDIAIAASRSLRRDVQVTELLAARARITPTLSERPNDPTDATAALADYPTQPKAGGVARLWIAARWNPRNVSLRATLLSAFAAGDPRRAVIVAELVALASDPDQDVGRAAVAALR